MVIGEPFTVDGELFTPADVLNYDSVGYASVDEGVGVTAAHRTLPLPTYAEVTSLETGKTVLVRVERRGPMIGKSLVALSPTAAAQLGEGERAAVRVRRVNPPEAERAELRAGRPVAARIETPKSLVEVLRRKLPPAGAASLRSPVTSSQPDMALKAAAMPASKPVQVVVAANPLASVPPNAVTAYPLPGLTQAEAAPRPVVVARVEASAKPVAASLAAVPPVPRAVAPIKNDSFVIQAGAFASRANADRAAKGLGGFVSTAGKLFRVRTGPFATRAQADAALAKVRAAGYSDARVTTAS